MHLLKISTLAISSLALTSATQLAELLRFKPVSSSAVTPAGPESIFSHVPASTKVPGDGTSENLEVRQNRGIWGSRGGKSTQPQPQPASPPPPADLAPVPTPPVTPAEPLPPLLESPGISLDPPAPLLQPPAMRPKPVAPHIPATTFSRPAIPTAPADDDEGELSTQPAAPSSVPAVSTSSHIPPTTIISPPPTVTSADPSVSIVVTTKWVETSAEAGRTWTPTTMTLLFKLYGDTPAPAPGKGEIGLGSITAQPSVTSTAQHAAAETMAPGVIGLGLVAGALGIAGMV